MNPRLICIRILHAVVYQGQSLHEAKKQYRDPLKTPQQRAIVNAWSHGCLRWWPQLDAWAQQLLHKDLKNKDRDIYCLLILALFQLKHSDLPPHACVNEAVSCCPHLGKHWAKALLNRLLRRAIDDKARLESELAHNNSYQFSHPSWMIAQLQQDWPHDWQDILMANNQQPPLTIRVNTARIRVDKLQRLFEQKKIEHRQLEGAPQALNIIWRGDIRNCPGFKEGFFAVQDAASQLVPLMHNWEEGSRVLDACAAPGGKSCHLLAEVPQLQLLCVDSCATRLQQIDDNLKRLQLPQVPMIHNDIINDNGWKQHGEFAVILLDAPCSGSGIIRRHPDIKVLRRATDIQDCAQLQLKLLHALWPQLQKGGVLLYTTCSIFHQENAELINRFIQETPDAQAQEIDHPCFATMHRQQHSYISLPGEGGRDGFSYTKLTRLTSAP